MSRYDFTEAAEFLETCVPLHDLYCDVCDSMHLLNSSLLSEEKKDALWHTLLTVADFLECITEKQPHK